MDSQLRKLLERQGAWQRERARLPWEEKLRQSVRLRETLRGLRMQRQAPDAEGCTVPPR